MADAKNPIPFNANTMSVSRVTDAADSLRQLFDYAMREGVSDADLGAQLRGTLADWQRIKS
jgi:hypothetical protein